jgi:hypothetical protein
VKIHIKKDKIEKKGLFGGGKSWFAVEARYELSEEERHLLDKNRHVLNMIAFDFPYRGPSGNTANESSPTVKQLTGAKEYPLGCVFSNGELQELEAIVTEGAKSLKAELYGGQLGSSTTEI